MVATGRLKNARRAITDLEERVKELELELQDRESIIETLRTDYEYANEHFNKLHMFVKDVSEGRSKHNKEAKDLLSD